MDCDTDYVSSTYRPSRCGSAQCSLAKAAGCSACFSPPGPGCNNNTCGLLPENPVTRTTTGGELAQDVLSLPSTDGSVPGPLATAPHFLFSCAPAFLLQGLADDADGMAGFGRASIALPSQLAAAFSLRRVFATCLASSPAVDGVIFFGGGPYNLLPNVDASQSLTYTPLIANPVCTAGTCGQGEKSDEYFIGVRSIKVGGEAVPLINRTLLSIDSNGVGGTKISTVAPYTVLETSIYKAVTAAFDAALGNVTRVPPAGTFEFCYAASGIGSTRVGPAVPAIDLVLQSESVYWRMFGANSMVSVSDQVYCLGFVDGGPSPRTSIVIGGHQLEDNLLQFDLATSRLGFSSTLLFRRTTCANFNFTSTA